MFIVRSALRAQKDSLYGGLHEGHAGPSGPVVGGREDVVGRMMADAASRVREHRDTEAAVSGSIRERRQSGGVLKQVRNRDLECDLECDLEFAQVCQ